MQTIPSWYISFQLVEREFFPRGGMPLAGGVGHAQAAIPWNHVVSFHAARIQKRLY